MLGMKIMDGFLQRAYQLTKWVKEKRTTISVIMRNTNEVELIDKIGIKIFSNALHLGMNLVRCINHKFCRSSQM